jgi:crotonobetainyl-CoA:carnitine CoA-transferase CaiB-like acyl-CoA transferase
MNRGPVNRASLRTSVQRQQPRERGIIGLDAFMWPWYAREHRPRKAFASPVPRAGRPAGPVLRYDETLHDEQVTAREMIMEMKAPDQEDGQ